MTEADLDSTILSPGFCIAEHHGIQEPKFRLIGDLAKSNVNKTVQMSEIYFRQGLDSFVALTRLQHVNGSEDLKQRSVDFPHAYKTIALRPFSAEASRICFLNPVDNRPYKCRILAQPFGSRMALANWGRVVTFLQFLARMLLSIAVGEYVDDVFGSESSFLAKSGFWAFGRLSPPTRIQYFGPEGSNTFDKYALSRCRCRVAEKRNTDPRNGRNSTQIT